MSESESESEISSQQKQLEILINEATVALQRATVMLIDFVKPGPEELERAAIWSDANISSQITVFELRDLFERIKPHAFRRPQKQTWFAFMRWLLWNQEI